MLGSHLWPGEVTVSRMAIKLRGIRLTLEHIDVIKLKPFETVLHALEYVLYKYSEYAPEKSRGAAYLPTEAILIDIARVIQIGPSESHETRLSTYDAIYLMRFL